MHALQPSPRAALTAIADRIPDVPLTLVVAPAGSGKSTLLSAWREALRAHERPVSVFDITALHDDAGSFVADWLDALEAAGDTRFPTARRVLAHVEDGEQGWPALARALLRDLRTSGTTLVAILDGYDALAPEGSAARLVDEVLRSRPARLRFVIASRSLIPKSAARFRVTGELIEVAPGALDLRPDEVAAVLGGHGVAPTSELVTSVLAQTEGWVTGVLIAARMLAETNAEDRNRRVSELASQPDLFAYFADEVLRRESAETLSVLEAVALLGRATSADIVEALGTRDAAAAAQAAFDRGLLHREDGSFHLPGLWRRVMRERVETRLDPEAWRGLNRRVAGILARTGRIDIALERLGSVSDWPACGVLLAKAGMQLMGLGRRRRVLEFLERLPGEVHDRDPELLHQHGLALIGLDPARAEQLLELAERGFDARGDADQARKVFGALAVLHLTEGRMTEFRQLVRRRMSLLRLVSDKSQRGAMVVALAGRALIAGRYARARRLAEHAARLPLQVATRWINAMTRIFVYGSCGEYDSALRVADEALADPEIARFALAFHSLRAMRALNAVVVGSAGERAIAIEDAQEAVAALGEFGLQSSRIAAMLLYGQAALAADDADRAIAVLADAVDLAARAGVRLVESRARVVLSEACWRAGNAARARSEAELACVQIDAEIRAGGTAFLHFLPRALWVRACAGDAIEAWTTASEHQQRLLRSDAPLLAVTAHLLLADIALKAGRSSDAERLAAEGWRISARARLSVCDPHPGRALVLATAPLALRKGVEVDHVTDRLLAEARHEATPILLACLRDGSVAARRDLATRMGRLGNRVYRDALATAASNDRDARVRKLAECALTRLDLRPRYRLRFETLGRFRAFRGDEEIAESEWRGITVRRVLARLLVAEGRPVPREVLLEDLWPDADPKQARNHLRVATSRLHAVLEPDRPEGVATHFVRSEGDALVLVMEGVATWDALAFEERLLAARTPSSAGGMDDLRRLFETSAGRLFPELRDEPWMEPIRRRLEQKWVGLGRTLGAALLSAGEFDACERVADGLLERDAANEAAWALRIRVRLGRGERAGALRVYDDASEALRRTVDASPGPELEGLAAEARAGST